MASDPICPLCERPIPPDVAQSRHHLVPRLRGGKGGPGRDGTQGIKGIDGQTFTGSGSCPGQRYAKRGEC